jgi:hypothetical protein
LIGGGGFILHRQLYHYLIVDVHCRRLCKSPNTLRARKAKVVATTTGCGQNGGDKASGYSTVRMLLGGGRRPGAWRWRSGEM